MTKIYSGRRTADGCAVAVDGQPLQPCGAGHAFGPGEFEWGYNGSGPSRLALAILADHFGDGTIARFQYRNFGEAVIANIRDDAWTLSGDQIDAVLEGAFDVAMTLDELFEKVRGAAI